MAFSNKFDMVTMGCFCKPVIFVADSRPEDYWLLAERAEAAGWGCRFVASAREALRLVCRCKPRLCLIGGELPDMSGLELCRTLRRRMARTPIFLVAGRYDAHLESAALAAGGIHFVCKPVSERWVADIVEAAARPAAASPGALSTRPAA